jgi:2,3-dihydroxy-p-cumate/2,3-dihydroxybenzoate 3,4-dioxygenase
MVRYKKLGFVELNVSDLDKSAEFYEKMVGLQYVGGGPGGALRFRCGDDPYSVVLHQSEEPGYKCSGWMMESQAQFLPLEKSLSDNGVNFEWLSAQECDARGFARALRIVEPGAGATVEFYINRDDSHYHFEASVASIKQLGHVVFATPNYEQSVNFYKNVLGFAESDTIVNMFTFMRPWPSPFHHGIGIGNTPYTAYHHTNFMVSEIDDVGRAIHRFNEADIPIVYGPGRHPASNSVFLYFLDPDGITCEYSFGMEQFPEGFERPPRKIPLSKTAGDYWGAPLDPRMGKTGVIETRTIAR